MRIAIVDDNQEWQQIVMQHIMQYPWSEMPYIKCYSDGGSFCNAETYDVVFMDIEMNGMDGFETAIHYREEHGDCILIFLTSHTELSRHGYKVNAFRYIDKSCIDLEMSEALDAVLKRSRQNHLLSFHALNLGDVQLALKDILYIETDKRNVLIHSTRGDYLSNRKIDELEAELEEYGFFRSHKSCLVNLEHVKRADQHLIYLKNHEKVSLAYKKVNDFKRKYMDYKFQNANA